MLCSVFSWYTLSFQLIFSVYSCFAQFSADSLSFQLLGSVFSWFSQFSADLLSFQLMMPRHIYNQANGSFQCGLVQYSMHLRWMGKFRIESWIIDQRGQPFNLRPWIGMTVLDTILLRDESLQQSKARQHQTLSDQGWKWLRLKNASDIGWSKLH